MPPWRRTPTTFTEGATLPLETAGGPVHSKTLSRHFVLKNLSRVLDCARPAGGPCDAKRTKRVRMESTAQPFRTELHAFAYEARSFRQSAVSHSNVDCSKRNQ